MHLWGGYAAGWIHRSDPAEIKRREAMLELTLKGWALDNPAFRQMFTSLYLPEASLEQQDWYNETQRITTSPENAEALQRVFGGIDVRPLLSKVTTRPSSDTARAMRRCRSKQAARSQQRFPAPASSRSKARTICFWKAIPAGRNTPGSLRNF
jgi:hypothetical protein